MAYELIASGGIIDVLQFSQCESLLAEGDRSLVELDLRWSPPVGVASELENKLRQEGVEDVRVTVASPMLRIYFRKGFPWLAVIAAIILATIVLLVLVTGWRIFREVVPEPLQFPVALLVIGIAAVGIALAQKGR